MLVFDDLFPIDFDIDWVALSSLLMAQPDEVAKAFADAGLMDENLHGVSRPTSNASTILL